MVIFNWIETKDDGIYASSDGIVGKSEIKDGYQKLINNRIDYSNVSYKNLLDVVITAVNHIAFIEKYKIEHYITDESIETNVDYNIICMCDKLGEEYIELNGNYLLKISEEISGLKFLKRNNLLYKNALKIVNKNKNKFVGWEIKFLTGRPVLIYNFILDEQYIIAPIIMNEV